MIRYYCDRCGKEIAGVESYTLFVQGPEIQSWDDNYMFHRKDYQICKDCIRIVTDFKTNE